MYGGTGEERLNYYVRTQATLFKLSESEDGKGEYIVRFSVSNLGSHTEQHCSSYGNLLNAFQTRTDNDLEDHKIALVRVDQGKSQAFDITDIRTVPDVEAIGKQFAAKGHKDYFPEKVNMVLMPVSAEIDNSQTRRIGKSSVIDGTQDGGNCEL